MLTSPPIPLSTGWRGGIYVVWKVPLQLLERVRFLRKRQGEVKFDLFPSILACRQHHCPDDTILIIGGGIKSSFTVRQRELMRRQRVEVYFAASCQRN